MTEGAWVLIAAVAAVLTLGLWRLGADGRFRGTHTVRGAEDETPATESRPTPIALPPNSQLGERATLLQFSSAFCAPCRATRHTLARVAQAVPGVTHVEIDAEHHLELVRRLRVLRTPTTLVLDAEGLEVGRASGAPREEQVLRALELTSP